MSAASSTPRDKAHVRLNDDDLLASKTKKHKSFKNYTVVMVIFEFFSKYLSTIEKNCLKKKK